MKTEQEIREACAGLAVAITPGCKCESCQGKLSILGTLRWALGEALPGTERAMQALIKEAHDG